MRLNKIILLCLVSMLSRALAGNPAAQSYEVQADQTYYDDHKKTATFLGHVTATEGESIIKGDTLILYFDQNKKVNRLVCDGHLASYQTLLNTRPKKLLGTAQHITYDAIHHQATFITQATVVRGNHTASGPYLQYNINESTMTTKTDARRQKTHITLQPEDVEQNS